MDTTELNQDDKPTVATYLSPLGLREIENCLKYLNESLSTQPLVLFGFISKTVKSLENLLSFKEFEQRKVTKGQELCEIIAILLSSDLIAKNTVDAGLGLKADSSVQDSAKAFKLLTLSLPKELDQNSEAGCDLLRLCCQCLCMLCNCDLNRYGLDSKLSEAELFILKNRPDAAKLKEVSELASALIRCLNGCASSAALKAMHILPTFDNKLQLQNNEALSQESLTLEAAKRIRSLIADAANIAKKGNLIPKEIKSSGSYGAVDAKRTMATSEKTPSLSELVAKASQLQQKFYKAGKAAPSRVEKICCGLEHTNMDTEQINEYTDGGSDELYLTTVPKSLLASAPDKIKIAVPAFAGLENVICALDSGIGQYFLQNEAKARAQILKDRLCSKIFDIRQLSNYLKLILAPFAPRNPLTNFALFLLQERLDAKASRVLSDAERLAYDFKTFLLKTLLSFISRCAAFQAYLKSGELKLPLPPDKNGLKEGRIEICEWSKDNDLSLNLQIYLQLSLTDAIKFKACRKADRLKITAVASNLELFENLGKLLPSLRLNQALANIKTDFSVRLGRPHESLPMQNLIPNDEGSPIVDDRQEYSGKGRVLLELAKLASFEMPPDFKSQISNYQDGLLRLNSQNMAQIAAYLAFLYRI